MADSFLTALTGGPEDLDTFVVYADWLEEKGLADRASFLRMQAKLLAMDPKKRGRKKLLEEINVLSKSLPMDWLDKVTRPRITNTWWSGKDSDGGIFVVLFLPGGKLRYHTRTGTFQAATWRQGGLTIELEMNNHFADYVGVLIGPQIGTRPLAPGDSIEGQASNVRHAKWTWTVDYRPGEVPPSLAKEPKRMFGTTPSKAPKT